MAKQTFTTGQVLTAAQMTSLQQTAMGGGSATAKTASYTLVAADAGATVIMNSASATTITVNTSLFSAGDTVFIQNLGAGVSTITPGTATVNTASSLALAQYESGNLYFTAAGASIFSKADGAAAAGGGYTLLSTINASAATSISFTSIPATYKHLFLVWTDCFSPSGAASGYWAARLNNDSGNNYYGQSFNNSPTSVNVSAASSFGAAANASPIGGTNSTALNADNSNGFMWVYDYVNGGKTTVHYEATGENAVIGNCRLFNGLYNGSAAIDRLDLIRNTTNTLTGTLKLYGVS